MLACLLLFVATLTAVFTLNAFAGDVTTAFTGTTLTLTEGTNIRFTGTLSSADREDAAVVYTFAGKTQTKDIVADENGTFAVDVPVGADEMHETVTAKIMVGGTAKASTTQSVKDYAAYQLKNGDSVTKRLVSEMLRYGEEAYKYTHGNASSPLLSDLALTDALHFPTSLAYTYAKDVTGTFKKIKLTLTDALRLTLTTNDGTTVKESVKISQFFDSMTATASNAASVTVSPSLYAELNKDSSKEGNLVKALYNYAVAVHSAIAYTQPDTHRLTHTQDAEHPERHNTTCTICQESVSSTHTLGEGIIDYEMYTITYACTQCSAAYTNAFVDISDFNMQDSGFLGFLDAADGNPKIPPAYDGKANWITSSANPVKAKEDVGFSFYTIDMGLSEPSDLVLGFDVIMPEGGFSKDDTTAALTLAGTMGPDLEGILDQQQKFVAKGTALYFNEEKIGECVAGVSYNIAISYHVEQTFSGCSVAYAVYLNGTQVYSVTQDYAADCGNVFEDEDTQMQFKFNKESWNMHNDTGIIYDNIYYADSFIGWEFL